MVKIPIVSFDIGTIKDKINKRIKEEYGDKPVFSSVLKKVASDDYIKLKLKTGIVVALDDFDTMVQIQMNLPYKPIFRMLNEKNIMVGMPMFIYSFEYPQDDEKTIVVVIKNMTEKSFLYNKIKEMFKTFSDTITEDEKEGIYERFINELFDSVEDALKDMDYILNDEKATIDDIAKEVTYKITGSYYHLLEKEDTV